MNRPNVAIALTLVLLGAAALGCGGDDASPSAPAAPIDVSGNASKGPIEAANVSLYRIEGTGGAGSLVAGPFLTDASGNWSGQVPAGTAENLLVVVRGGSYEDEATSSTVEVTSELYGVWRPFTKIGNASPVTHAIVLNAQQRIRRGATVSAAFTDALDQMLVALGWDASAVTPALPKGVESTPAQELAVLLAGLAQLIDSDAALDAFSAANVWDLVIACAQDLSDGILQGVDAFGEPIFVDPDGDGPGAAIAFPVLDSKGMGAWVAAANAWAAVHAPGITLADIDLTDFANTGGSTGGQGTVSGLLAVSGSGTGAFASPFAPTHVGVSEQGPIVAFVFVDLTRLVSVVLNEDNVSTVTAAVSGLGWGASAPFGSGLAGISVTRAGAEWTLQFQALSLPATVGAQSTLVLNGTLVVNQGAGIVLPGAE